MPLESCPFAAPIKILIVESCRKTTDHGYRSISPFESSWFTPLILAHKGSAPPGSSTMELSAALAEHGTYSTGGACHCMLARVAAPYQAFRDSATCLSHATHSRRAPNWSSKEAPRVDTTLNQPNRRHVSTNRLNRVDRQLVSSLEGESDPTSTGKTLSHSYSKTNFRRERARMYVCMYVFTHVPRFSPCNC